MPLAAERVYLDRQFTRALVAAAFRERLIPAYNDGRADYEQRFVAAADDSLLGDALELFVLYGSAVLDPSFDNFDMTRLAGDGLTVAESRTQRDPTMTFPVDPEAFSADALEYPTAELLRGRGHRVSAADVTKTLTMAETYSAAMDYLFTMGIVQMMSPTYGDRPPQEVRAFDAKLDKARALQQQLLPMLEAMAEVQALVDASRAYEGPVLWECSTVHPEAVLPAAIPDQLRVAQLYFTGLAGIRVDSVEDALNLREDQNIQELRGEVFGAIHAIETGKASIPQLRRRIERANKIVASLKRVERQSRLMAWLPFPAKLIPGLPEAIEVLNLGGELAKKRWRWAFVSNAQLRVRPRS